MVHRQYPLSDEACERSVTTSLETGCQQNLQRYEEAFTKAIYRQYPLSDNDREFLVNLRQVLEIGEKTAQSIEEQATHAHKQKLQQYEEDFTWTIHQQYPLGDEARRQLRWLQQSLGLTEESINSIEARVTQRYEEKSQQQYEAVLTKAIQRQYPLSNNDCELLANLRRVLNLGEEVTDIVEARVVKAYTLNSSPSTIDLQGGKYNEKVRQLQLTAIVAAVALAGMSGLVHYGYVQWQADQAAKVAWEQTKTLETEKKYEACVNQAKAIPQESRFYPDAQKLLNQCQGLAQDEKWLAQAKAFATKSNFKDAIAEGSKIHPDSSFRQEAQQLIGLWSENLLKQVEGLYQKAYNSKDLDNAINITKVIPQTSSVAQRVRETMVKWRTEWNKNETYLQSAQSALKDGNWGKAIDQANKVRLLGQEVMRNTPYWQNKVKPIIETAGRSIAAKNSQESVTTQPPTPRQSTRQRSAPDQFPTQRSTSQQSTQKSGTQPPSTQPPTPRQSTRQRATTPRQSTTQRFTPRRSSAGSWPSKQL